MILEVKDLFKTYRLSRTISEHAAVRGISFGIAAGEILSFLGPNGAGKTTTIKMIAGLIKPTAGQITVAGLDPQSDRGAAREIGAVLEGNRNIYWRLTPQENLEYFGALRGLSRRVSRARGKTLLKRLGLSEQTRAEVRSLSRGMQQKVAIAVAVLHEPHLLLLDEPTLGLDPRSCDDVKRLVMELADEGRAVLLTTHQLDVAEEVSDRLALIRKGQLVVNGTMNDVLSADKGNAYTIRFKGLLSQKQLAALASKEIRIEGESLRVFGATAELYTIIEILKPIQIVSLSCERKRLSEVFLELAYESTEGSSIAVM